MDEKDKRLIQDINSDMGESLRKIIVKYLLKDDKYCEELNRCLNGEKERFIHLNLEERKDWINNNWCNAQRGYIVKTFTYYWLYKLCLQGEDYYLDSGWRNSLDSYFNDDEE